MPSDPIRHSTWWKFDSYVVRDHALRAEPGSLQTYDPWQRFEEVRGRYRQAPTLWGEFIAVVHRIQEQALDRYTPSVDGEGLILNWSNQYGLLGILPAAAQSIVLPPTYEHSSENPVYGPGVAAGRPCIVQRSYQRVAGRWVAPSQIYGCSNGVDDPPQWKPGDKVPRAQRPTGIDEPHTVQFEWEDCRWKREEGSGEWGAFFPSLLVSGNYPRPLSPEFWANYQEPLLRWMRAAVVFADAVEEVSRYASVLYAGEHWPNHDLVRLNQGIWILNWLASWDTQTYAFGPVALQRESTSGSLLSAMAEMFFRDLLAGRRALRCRACNRIFVSNDQRAGYCCRTCRNTSQMRRYRQNLKQR